MSRDPTAERLIIAILMLFLIGYGWFVLWQGGIAVRGRNGAVSYAEGGYALAIATGAFLFAALVSLLLARSLRLRRPGIALMFSAILLPPLAYVLTG
ncbi:MAG: hypothetical protein J0M09_14760 [Xanthomonadales bacterium]|nr:hypothetical protein [Xanthomonadales bacterium]